MRYNALQRKDVNKLGKTMISTKKASERLGVSVWLVRKYIRNGWLEASKFGVEWRIEPESLEKFIRERSNCTIS